VYWLHQLHYHLSKSRERKNSLIWMSSAFPLAAGCVQGLHHLHADLNQWLVSKGIKGDWWCNNWEYLKGNELTSDGALEILELSVKVILALQHVLLKLLAPNLSLQHENGVSEFPPTSDLWCLCAMTHLPPICTQDLDNWHLRNMTKFTFCVRRSWAPGDSQEGSSEFSHKSFFGTVLCRATL
jgi:hypothetical protein